MRARPEGSFPWLALLVFLCSGCLALMQMGCASPAETAGLIGGTVAAGTLVGAYSPGQELEQVYYLGIFDPQEQVPPEVYRLTVHGQASALSGVKFASGWVPAALIDSLSGHIEMNVNNTNGSGLTLTRDDATKVSLASQRRLIQFGPEGFREAPKDYRLVIVMGASPKAFFDAVDEALGSLSTAQSDRTNVTLERDILKVLRDLDVELTRWEDFKKANDKLLKNGL